MKSTRPKFSPSAAPAAAPAPSIAIVRPATDERRPGRTGRYLVSMRRTAVSDGINALRDRAGLKVASSSDFDSHVMTAAGVTGADALVLEHLGIAVVAAPPEQVGTVRLAAAEGGPLWHVTAERFVHVALPPPNTAAGQFVGANTSLASYLAGYRDGVNSVVESLVSGGSMPRVSEAGPQTESQGTWGLQATRTLGSQFSGAGIKIAVLDTGMDVGHPDFQGRTVVPASFVAGAQAQDGHGHGTHCIGTACGPRQPGSLPRYGVAYGAEIYAGKVLDDSGSGVDFDILGGINWALEQKCPIISISIAGRVRQGEPFEALFEETAKQALEEGSVIFVAAGNDSDRPTSIAPVSHPANCPSMYAVAAVDSRLAVASFSNGAVNGGGGEVNIAGPGVAVRSAWPRPELYDTINGTSMATPHVAGIAALVAEATGLRGKALANRVLAAAARINAAESDVGRGLVQAP